MINYTQPWLMQRAASLQYLFDGKTTPRDRVAHYLEFESSPSTWYFAIANASNDWVRVGFILDTSTDIDHASTKTIIKVTKQLEISLERVRFFYFNRSPDFSYPTIRICSTSKTTESTFQKDKPYP